MRQHPAFPFSAGARARVAAVLLLSAFRSVPALAQPTELAPGRCACEVTDSIVPERAPPRPAKAGKAPRSSPKRKYGVKVKSNFCAKSYSPGMRKQFESRSLTQPPPDDFVKPDGCLCMCVQPSLGR